MSIDVLDPGPKHWPGMDQQQAVEFFAATQDGTAIDGWHWLIEWSTTSFYIKSLNPAMEQAKVSLHGPDPKHPGKQHLRFDLVSDAKLVEKSKRAGGRWLDGSMLPAYFTGRQVRADAALVVRYAVEYDAFAVGDPPAGGSRWPKEKATFKAVLPVPKEGHVIHVDIYLSVDQPYWPDEASLRDKQAGMGPITNGAGMHLTAIVVSRGGEEIPNPCGDTRGVAPVDQCFRGLAAGIDDDGVLWLCDKLIPIVGNEAGG
ncbi:hypothetical protein [Mycobacterium sp. UM_WGJ]|uniref:hypothetical protein n=1 Tax=Mycobacterium sp. UM_WGJ TaxID=1370120 RepID=UPI0012DEA45F|nr:hypothetical protein [Mycobacterium sp. UM_WGJ]